LDIYLFLALNEYFAATGTSFSDFSLQSLNVLCFVILSGDFDFLQINAPFHPRNESQLPPGAEGRTVLDHIRVAFTHLKDSVGVGPHGLLRVLQGDWDDGISYVDVDPLAIDFTVDKGESIPNTLLAIYTLPILSSFLEPFDSYLASEMRSFSDSLRDPALSTFGGRWFGRAWLRTGTDEPYLYGNDQQSDVNQYTFLDLQPQPWGILSGLLDSDQQVIKTKSLLSLGTTY